MRLAAAAIMLSALVVSVPAEAKAKKHKVTATKRAKKKEEPSPVSAELSIYAEQSLEKGADAPDPETDVKLAYQILDPLSIFVKGKFAAKGGMLDPDLGLRAKGSFTKELGGQVTMIFLPPLSKSSKDQGRTATYKLAAGPSYSSGILTLGVNGLVTFWQYQKPAEAVGENAAALQDPATGASDPATAAVVAPVVDYSRTGAEGSLTLAATKALSFTAYGYYLNTVHSDTTVLHLTEASLEADYTIGLFTVGLGAKGDGQSDIGPPTPTTPGVYALMSLAFN